MRKNNKSLNPAQKRFADLVGIDFSKTATKAVRLKKTKEGCALVGMELLPPIDFNVPSHSLELPRQLAANYCCLAYNGPGSVIRMVNAPVGEGEEVLPETKLRELLNINEDFRVSVKLTNRGAGRKDSTFLASAIPKHDLENMLRLFPAGPPAAASIEVAGLSFVSAFLNARGVDSADAAVCLLDTGETMSNFVFLNKNKVSLVGRLSFGVAAIREKVASDLGVDQDLAASILADRSIDISSSVRAILEPFLKQLSISMDFLERHQGSRISTVYVSGGMSLAPSWCEEVGRLVKAPVEPWSPLENVEVDSAAVSDELIKQATRFSAAIGAAIGGLQ